MYIPFKFTMRMRCLIQQKQRVLLEVAWKFLNLIKISNFWSFILENKWNHLTYIKIKQNIIENSIEIMNEKIYWKEYNGRKEILAKVWKFWLKFVDKIQAFQWKPKIKFRFPRIRCQLGFFLPNVGLSPGWMCR